MITSPREEDRAHGCLCSWRDDYLIARVARSCPIGEHRAAFWSAWRARQYDRLTPLVRGVRVAIDVLSGRPRMSEGDLVIFLADPLLFGGELYVREVTSDNRLLCEAVHYDEDETPVRVILEPHEVELASRWARQAA